MFSMTPAKVFGEVWWAVHEEGILVGVWKLEDIPEQYKNLKEKVMPLYDYKCQEHGDFEAIKKIADREEAKCPECDAICPQALSAPKMVKGGYMDKSMKFSKSV